MVSIKLAAVLMLSFVCSQALQVDDDAIERSQSAFVFLGIAIRNQFTNPLYCLYKQFSDIYEKSLQREIKIFAETGQRSEVYEKYEGEVEEMKKEEM